MRHLGWLLFAIGCGGGDAGGEPLTGTVTLNYGDDTPKLAVGAAVQDPDQPTKMIVQLGTGSVDCDFLLEDFEQKPPNGTYVTFTVDKATTAMTSTSVAVIKITSRSLSLNSTTGSVGITALEPRVAGSVTFATTDDEVGEILVAGTFDVIRCF